MGLNGPGVAAQTIEYYRACFALVQHKGGQREDDQEDDQEEEKETRLVFVQRVTAHVSKFLFHMFHKGVPEFEAEALQLLVAGVAELPEACLERLQLQDIITLQAARGTLPAFVRALVGVATAGTKQGEMSAQDVAAAAPALRYVARLQCRFPSFLVQALHNVCRPAPKHHHEHHRTTGP